MTEKQISWTAQQLRAITARGSDVLVSASAGTGKTAVLSGRAVKIVSDQTLCPDVGGILVLTFTNAAAEQMRLRIRRELVKSYRQTPHPHLRRQLMLLQAADISTIHSFCKRLITAYFHELGLDPTFRVIEEDEQRLLKAEILEKTIEWAWQQSNLAPELGRLFYRRDLRSNDGFLQNIIAVSDFLDTIVSRDNWYQRAEKIAEAAAEVGSDLGNQQKRIVAERLHRIRLQLRHCQTLYNRDCHDDAWLAGYAGGFAQTVEQCIELLQAGDWSGCAEKIITFQKPTVKKPSQISAPLAELIKETAGKAVNSFARLVNLAVLNPAYVEKVAGSAGAQTKILVELVEKFDSLYDQAKHELNCLDFADLEHRALKLLIVQDQSGRIVPSETALALRSRYKYVFVDEYQDINSVQQAILDAVSCEDNVFCVGDIKQSIYTWRGAEPGIFLERLKAASSASADKAAGLRVDLNTNFRSHKGVLDFVNKVFERLMTASFASIDYDESARLTPASEQNNPAAPNDGKAVVEIHLLDEKRHDAGDGGEPRSGPNPTSSTLTSRQLQAAVIARRIRQMVGAGGDKAEFEVYDKQNEMFRDVQYRDIVILMRSLAKKADFIEVLRLAGVPVNCDAIAGYFEATEISDMLCLLKVLDNPRRDIELAAVLRSPLFNVTDSELAKVKLHGKSRRHGSDFYDRVLDYSLSGSDARLTRKLSFALGQIEKYRTLARRGKLADLIWQLYRETGLLSFVCALPNGRARRANLLKLHDRAIQFEDFAGSRGVPSLTRFVAFIEKLQELGQDWAPAEPDSSGENAVRVLSVHKSKGLEFPVVFLAELNGRFNKSHVYADCLADAESGIGLQVIDPRSNSRLSSLAHQVIAERREEALLAEEMRILYVAATRARQRLILTASGAKESCRTILSNGLLSGRGAVPEWRLRTCQSPLQWLLYSLCDQRDLHTVFQTNLAKHAGDDNLFDLVFYEQTELQELSRTIESFRKTKVISSMAARKKSTRCPPESKALLEVKKSLAWRYPFEHATVLPAKRSVTQLTHSGDEYVRFDYSQAFRRRPRALTAEAGISEPIDSRVRGTAVHLLISRLDLTGGVNEQTISRTKEKLLADGIITEAIADCIDAHPIISFFESKLGRIVLDSNNVVRREWPFTFAMPACESDNAGHEPLAGGEELTVVQGIIDMLVHTPEGLLVIDFKTDAITADNAAERAKIYRRQLQIYSRAASAILQARTAAAWLYFLAPGCAVEI